MGRMRLHDHAERSRPAVRGHRRVRPARPGPAHELGLEALADVARLHWTFVGQVERRNLTLHNILKLAAALRLDAGELVRGIAAPQG